MKFLIICIFFIAFSFSQEQALLMGKLQNCVLTDKGNQCTFSGDVDLKSSDTSIKMEFTDDTGYLRKEIIDFELGVDYINVTNPPIKAYTYCYKYCDDDSKDIEAMATGDIINCRNDLRKSKKCRCNEVFRTPLGTCEIIHENKLNDAFGDIKLFPPFERQDYYALR